MPEIDAYGGFAPSPSTPARRAQSVTPSDITDLNAVAKSLYVGAGGDVRIVPAGGGAAVTFVGHPSGYLPVQVSRVMASGTTAGALIALFD